MADQYQVLSFYHYTPVDNPEQLRDAHHRYCLEKNLRGRIKVAPEGINGKLSGRKEDCQAYIKYLQSDPRFTPTAMKVDDHTGYASEKLHVRIKKEIVNAGMPYIKPYEKTGISLSPQAFEKMVKEEDVVLLDVRSTYETMIGHFKGSLFLKISSMREFPAHLPVLEKYKNKPIITICTGKIKSEKASAYLLSKGFEKVYQLDGGILRYGKETDGSLFQGACYVFDNRLIKAINTKNPTIISHCYVCQKPSQRMVNCANMLCNLHAPICAPCGEKYQGACSENCMASPKKRTYNGTGYYVKKSNGYNPYKAAQRAVKRKRTVPC